MFVCRICGGSYEHLNGSHLRTHGLSTSEYEELYPDSERYDLAYWRLRADIDIQVEQKRDIGTSVLKDITYYSYILKSLRSTGPLIELFKSYPCLQKGRD